jgi:hypothetical protein
MSFRRLLSAVVALLVVSAAAHAEGYKYRVKLLEPRQGLGWGVVPVELPGGNTIRIAIDYGNPGPRLPPVYDKDGKRINPSDVGDLPRGTEVVVELEDKVEDPPKDRYNILSVRLTHK